MLDLWSSELQNFIPWVAFVTGLGGSLHCVGMCGGLVTASCHNHAQVVRYQLGRLLSYLLLGLIGGSLGHLIQFKNAHPLLNVAPALFIGGLFVLWGVQSLCGKKTWQIAPKALSRSYQHLWQKWVVNNHSRARSFVVGALSILLPCGFLYAIVLGSMATQSPAMALLGMFFFWLGTLPSMLLAPTLIHKILRPFRTKRPKIYALCLVFVGLSTIAVRASSSMQEHYHNPKQEVPMSSCH